MDILGNESQPNHTSTIYKFNLITMKNDSSVVVNEVNACWNFSYNNQVYALFDRSPGKIVIFDTNLNITQERNNIARMDMIPCNEFVVTEDSIYILHFGKQDHCVLLEYQILMKADLLQTHKLYLEPG